jgi:predicted CoA-binding protein
MGDFFNSYKRLAFVGLSGDPKSFSRGVFKFLSEQGYEIYPVNPALEQVENQKCYKSIDSVPAVEAVLFFTNPRVTSELLSACKAKGIEHVWFQQGAADEEVLNIARQLNLDYQNSCVYLHHNKAGFPHSFHRFINRTFKLNR